jgi:hypothetical protein
MIFFHASLSRDERSNQHARRVGQVSPTHIQTAACLLVETSIINYLIAANNIVELLLFFE